MLASMATKEEARQVSRLCVACVLVTMACGGTGDLASSPPSSTREPAPSPALVHTPTPAAVVDAGAIAPANTGAAPATPPPDPLAGKSPEEQWAWAVSLVPSLNDLVRHPSAASFEALGLKRGRITLYAPALDLTLARKQPAPCAALSMVLEEGELATRIARDGSRARSDLKDDYIVFRLGVTIFDHEAVAGDLREGYADASIGGVLSEVSRRGLRYDGGDQRMVAYCQTDRITHHCRDGSTKVCESCNPVVTPVNMRMGPGTGGIASDSPCDACPPDPVAPHIEAINRVLAAQPVMEVDKGTGVAFYVRRADCKAALRAMRRSRTE